jgi:hypothetical protein
MPTTQPVVTKRQRGLSSSIAEYEQERQRHVFGVGLAAQMVGVGVTAQMVGNGSSAKESITAAEQETLGDVGDELAVEQDRGEEDDIDSDSTGDEEEDDPEEIGYVAEVVRQVKVKISIARVYNFDATLADVVEDGRLILPFLHPINPLIREFHLDLQLHVQHRVNAGIVPPIATRIKRRTTWPTIGSEFDELWDR